MNSLLSVLALVMYYSRAALLVATCGAAIACGAAWLLRTKRLSPFSPVARFVRDHVDPRLRPIERAVLNAGGSLTSAPWWGLAAFAVLGLVLQQLLGYLAGMLVVALSAASGGGRGIVRALAQLTFGILQLALMIRVVSSWFVSLSRVRWLRWTYSLTEPLLQPLRSVLPALGPFDISPLILFYLLRFVGDFVLRSI